MRSSAVGITRPRVAHQTEIEDDHASVGPDHDVGGLDVAMELAFAVQRRQARHHLPQDAPHQAGVGALLGTGRPRVAPVPDVFRQVSRPPAPS